MSFPELYYDSIDVPIAVWFLIVVLRIFAIFVLPDDKHLIRSGREQAADFWFAMARTVVVAPAIAFFYVLKSKTAGGLDGLGIILQVQLAWFLLSLAVFGLWVFMSKRKGGRWGY